MSNFKPLLAAPVDFKHLDYTNLWLSPKLDGIRAIVINGVVVSRNLKPIRNRHIQALFGGRPELEGFDGELIVGEPTAKDCYQVTNSGVMSADGEPNVQFYVFDKITDPTLQYCSRYRDLSEKPYLIGVQIVPQIAVESEKDLIEIEEMYLAKGYEGVMLREHSGPRSFYKFGRSTSKECTLLKLKRFSDKEATVTGFQELMKNGNEATKDALGHTERSAHKEGMIPMDTLGALICRTVDGVEFNIGTGFDQATRAYIWANRDQLLGGLAKYKSFDIGVKDAPRFPVFLGFRDAIDV